MMLQIQLGWPNKALNPNSRAHYMALSRAKKAAKEEAFWATRAALGHGKFEHDGGKLRLTITAYPPDRRARDDDNLAASCKAARDGIANSLGIDDKHFEQAPIIWGEPETLGKLIVTLGPAA